MGKRYRIGAQVSRYRTLRETLVDTVGIPFRRVSGALRGRIPSNTGQEIWALKDVSFEIGRGEVVGVIGRNGAGKTTLLKILSRITKPTLGSIDLYGRVGSLLEVGTGFHPELTGRENIYLNGAILGMKKAEIDEKFDDIVEFAEIGRFLDTPAKRYSSGMYVRLAFSVAAHMDPDILLVDEVLSVGDASFQKKSLGRMGQVAADGRTVLLVSHNLQAIAGLTRSCVWIDRGQVVEYGPTPEVIQKYLMKVLDVGDGKGEANLLAHPRARQLPRDVEFRILRLLEESGNPTAHFAEGKPMTIEVTFQVKNDIQFMELDCKIHAREGQRVFSVPLEKHQVEMEAGQYTIATLIKPNFLRPGGYYVALTTQTAILQDEVDDAIFFEIEFDPGKVDNSYWQGERGVVRFDYKWGQMIRREKQVAGG